MALGATKCPSDAALRALASGYDLHTSGSVSGICKYLKTCARLPCSSANPPALGSLTDSQQKRKELNDTLPNTLHTYLGWRPGRSPTKNWLRTTGKTRRWR